MRNSTRRTATVVSRHAHHDRLGRARKLRTTLGELIVAAFDIAGNRVPEVAHLLASPEFGRAAHGRIVLVQ
jgi:hypothetical protein